MGSKPETTSSGKTLSSKKSSSKITSGKASMEKIASEKTILEKSTGSAPATKSSPNKNASKMHRRSRSGCFTCRLRRKKCDEGQPKCKACRHLGLDCEYKRPLWWSNNETRRRHKDQIKNLIKRTKTTDKTTVQTQYSTTRAARASSESMSDSPDIPQDQSFGATPVYDPALHPYYSAHLPHSAMYGHAYPYEVDVKTERQMFINDIPTRRDSTISTFSTFMPPPAHAMLPSCPEEEWITTDMYSHEPAEWSGEEDLDFNFFDFSHGQPPSLKAQSAMIPVDECDRDLLDHLLDNVLRQMFPILEANQHGSVKAEVIIPALENNKAYLHCCLSAAALHLKATQGNIVDTLDNDILRHKFAFVSEVVNALSTDSQHVEVLEATLGMIALQCCVGRADEQEKDIPWHQHFQAAVELVNKLELPQALEDMPMTGFHPPFNMTLTAWIDILGATMLGKAPAFAHTYRTKHLSGSTSGLSELMGCHDAVMYLLSEVACLDNLKSERRLDDIAVCSHITSLAQQLDATEIPGEVLQFPYSKSGALRPRQLSKTITAIFRKAVRVYLCALVPDYNRYSVATINLIASMTEMLQYIPTGPEGFDSAIVWPLLICGAHSVPASPFRRVLAERIDALGDTANHGSFGRMIHVLHEVWRQNDDLALSAGACEATPITARSPGGSLSTPILPITVGQTRPRNVHWRDVMQHNGWDYLLI